MIAALSPRVQSYPLPAIYPVSEDFAVTVNGENVPVTAFAPEPGGGSSTTTRTSPSGAR
jgi:hypothetical protein